MSIKPIRLKEKEAIIQSLKSGVTPKIGLQHIQVGRSKEISALNKDIDRVIEGGSTFRLIIGEYGSGKTFFLSVVRSIALEKNWSLYMLIFHQIDEFMLQEGKLVIYILN
jgi:transcriptional regulator with GAF, ATPase, and Fis domain